MGKELNIEERKIALGLTGVLGTKANQCKIVLKIKDSKLLSFMILSYRDSA